MLRPHPIQQAMLNIGMPGGAKSTAQSHEVTVESDHIKLTFIHIIHNAFVRSSGDIYANGKSQISFVLSFALKFPGWPYPQHCILKHQLMFLWWKLSCLLPLQKHKTQLALAVIVQTLIFL